MGLEDGVKDGVDMYNGSGTKPLQTEIRVESKLLNNLKSMHRTTPVKRITPREIVALVKGPFTEPKCRF
jgi:hypothetical protein